MGVPVVLAATTTSWLGTARVPKILAGAGFDVSLLTPRNSLAESSRFVTRVGYVSDHATRSQWLDAFAAMARATVARLVIPCDDMAFRLLASIVTEPPQDTRAERQLQLAALVRTSLGDPAHFRASVDKTLLPPLAEALGIRVPSYAIVSTLAGAEAFAARNGYPVVLKRSHGFAGQGVVICADRDDLARGVSAFVFADAQEISRASHARYLIQRHVTGRVQYFHAAAWRGTLLAGWALEKLVANPSPTGPPTVTRYFQGSELRPIASELARRLGISGLFFAEFIVDAATQAPYLLEINRRVSPATHRGADRNVDLGAALYAALEASPSKSRSALAAAEEGVTVHFPQEWLRDPDSEALRRYPSDAPWDEPDLFEALVRLRH